MPAMRHSTGATLVEFVIILPLFLIILFAIIEFGVLIYDRIILINAVNIASRQAIVYRLPRPTSNQISQIAVDFCANNLINFGQPSAPNVTVDWHGLQPVSGNAVTVSISYAFTGLMLSDAIFNWSHGETLTASATMIVE